MHLVDITMFYAPQSGGVRRYLDAKRNWFLSHTEHQYSLVIPSDCETTENNVHSLPAMRLPFGHGYRFPVISHPWRSKLKALKPDIIEVEDPYRLAWVALSVGKSLNVPVVGFYHSDIVKLYGERFGKMNEKLMSTYVAKLYERFDLVMAPSASVENSLQALDLRNVALCPFGVDTDLFNPAFQRPWFKSRLGISDNTTLLTFVGRNSAEKNIDLLTEMMDILGSQYHLLLVGPDMPQTPANNITVWSEYVVGQALSEVLASADIFVHAGNYETFGFIIAEAMACGTPVVGFARGAVPELVDDSVGKLAHELSPSALATCVKQLAQQDLRLKSARAHDKIKKTLSWDLCFKNLVAHYESLVYTRQICQST